VHVLSFDRVGQKLCVTRLYDDTSYVKMFMTSKLIYSEVCGGKQDHVIDLRVWRPCSINVSLPYHPIDNTRVMVIVWRLRGNIVRAALYWVVWHNVHSQQHTYMNSSYRSSRLGLSQCDPYAMHRGSCKTNWFPSVLWHCWFGHM